MTIKWDPKTGLDSVFAIANTVRDTLFRGAEMIQKQFTKESIVAQEENDETSD